jgi:hypothetical protein
VLDKFKAQSRTLAFNLASAKRSLKQYLKEMTQIQKRLFQLSETSVTLQTIVKVEATTDDIYRTLD